MRNIERKVDRLIGLKAGGKNVKKEKRQKTFIRRMATKVTPMTIMGLVVATVFALSLQYFIFIDTNVDIDSLISFDGNYAEEMNIDESFSGLPGDTVTYDHTITLSAAASNNVIVLFTWTGDTAEINAAVVYDGSTVSELELVPGVTYDISTQYEVKIDAASGSYNIGLKVTEQSFGY